MSPQSFHTHKPDSEPAVQTDLRSIGRLFPYLWEFRGRVLLSLALLLGAKFASVSVPLVLKEIIDSLGKTQTALILPLTLIIGYGLLRFSSTTFADKKHKFFLFLSIFLTNSFYCFIALRGCYGSAIFFCVGYIIARISCEKITL